MKIFCSDSLSLSRRREFSHFELWNPSPHCTLVIMSLFGYEQIEFHDDDDEEIDDKSNAGENFWRPYSFSFLFCGRKLITFTSVTHLSAFLSLVCVRGPAKFIFPPSWLRDLSLAQLFFWVIFIFFSFHHFFGLLPIFYRVRVCVCVYKYLSLSFLCVRRPVNHPSFTVVSSQLRTPSQPE